MLFLTPLALSYVNLIPFYNTFTGNYSNGIAVSQILNSLFTSLFSNPSYSLSKSPIQLIARWQFCRNSHLPSFTHYSHACSANHPCPYPKDLSIKLPLKLILSASEYNSLRGSAPGERIKIRGFRYVESL